MKTALDRICDQLHSPPETWPPVGYEIEPVVLMPDLIDLRDCLPRWRDLEAALVGASETAVVAGPPEVAADAGGDAAG